jgi:isopentenyl diphosphate isomerase/L-lactate dehydrogenase-like FMN-dependent dehydrogenase
MPSPPQPARSLGIERQFAIYREGLAGRTISVPVSHKLLEARAREVMAFPAFEYVSGGAGGEDTMRANREAFRRWRIAPRMLRNVSSRDLSVTVLGRRFPAPLFLAPVGVQGIVHPDGELAVARAAASLGVPMILSTVSSFTLEQVAQALGPTPRWFQLYWSSDPDLAASFLRRAEAAGYEAVVVTVDTPMLAWRERDLAEAYLPFLQGHGLANYLSDPVFHQALPEPPERNPAPAIERFAAVFGNASLTWDDLPWLRRHTRLPVLIKGIVRAEDAERAVNAGVDGIIVSNHGGRQVDGALASLDSLVAVADRVGGKIPILFDSGIRRGADAFKALALGATAVLLGRLYVWGLGVAGETGVQDVLHNFLADFDLTLGLSGYASVAELDRSALVRTGS